MANKSRKIGKYQENEVGSLVDPEVRERFVLTDSPATRYRILAYTIPSVDGLDFAGGISSKKHGVLAATVGWLLELGVIESVITADGVELRADSPTPDFNVPEIIRALSQADFRSYATYYRIKEHNFGDMKFSDLIVIMEFIGGQIKFSDIAMANQGFTELVDYTKSLVLPSRAAQLPLPDDFVYNIQIGELVKYLGGNFIESHKAVSKSQSFKIRHNYIDSFTVQNLIDLGIITGIRSPEDNVVERDGVFELSGRNAIQMARDTGVSVGTVYRICGTKIYERELGFLVRLGYQPVFAPGLDNQALKSVVFYGKKNTQPTVIKDFIYDHDIDIATLATTIGMSKSTLYRKLEDCRNFSRSEFAEVAAALKSYGVNERDLEDLSKYHRSLFSLDEAQTPETFLARLLKYHGLNRVICGFSVYHELSEFGPGIKTQERLQELLTIILGSEDKRDYQSKADAARAAELFETKNLPAKKWDLIDEAQSLKLLLSRLITYYDPSYGLVDKAQCRVVLSEVNYNLPSREWVKDLLEKLDASPADIKLVWEMYELESQMPLHVEIASARNWVEWVRVSQSIERYDFKQGAASWVSAVTGEGARTETIQKLLAT